MIAGTHLGRPAILREPRRNRPQCNHKIHPTNPSPACAELLPEDALSPNGRSRQLRARRPLPQPSALRYRCRWSSEPWNQNNRRKKKNKYMLTLICLSPRLNLARINIRISAETLEDMKLRAAEGRTSLPNPRSIRAPNGRQRQTQTESCQRLRPERLVLKAVSVSRS